MKKSFLKMIAAFLPFTIAAMFIFTVSVAVFAEDGEEEWEDPGWFAIGGKCILEAEYDEDDTPIYLYHPENLPAGATFDRNTSTLTLDNVTVNSAGSGGTGDYIYVSDNFENFTIILKGKNTFTGAEASYGIDSWAENGVHIKGATADATLTFDMPGGGYETGIYGNHNIVIEDCTVNIKGTTDYSYFYGMSLNAWGGYADGYNDAYIKIKNSTVNITNSTQKEGGLNLGIDSQDANLQIENSIVNISLTGGSCWGMGSGLYDEFEDTGFYGGKLSIDDKSWVSIQLKDPSSSALDYDAIYAIYYYTDDIQSKNIYAGNYGGSALLSGKQSLSRHTWIDERTEFTKTLLIFSPFRVQLSDTSFDWTGNEIRPTVTVTDNNGNTVSADNYSVAYRDNVNAGFGYVDVTMKGAYSGVMSALFTINKKADDSAVDPADKPADNTAVITDGTTFTVSGSKVKVISAASGTVAFTQANNTKSVTVPATVNIGGKTFKVTQINANAFKGSKIKKITIGKNVKVIKANAFKGSKATTLILKTKLLKKAKVKGSLKGSKIKTIQVKVSSKKTENKKYVKNYKKIFTKANAGKKVTVK